MQMHRTVSLVSGAGLGVGLTYFFDPDRGRRRRAFVHDKGLGRSKRIAEFDGAAAKETGNGVIGMGPAAKSWVQPAPPGSDRTLVERVRGKLGEFSRHASAIDVQATEGTVTLSGPVLEDEFDGICNAIARVPGVAQIFNRLERHGAPDVPALQEPQHRKPGSRFPLIQSNWLPTARTAAALMGAAAMLYGASRRTAGAVTVAASGLGLLVRSMTNQEFGKKLNFRIGSVGQT
jgi:hypothetical protein